MSKDFNFQDFVNAYYQQEDIVPEVSGLANITVIRMDTVRRTAALCMSLRLPEWPTGPADADLASDVLQALYLSRPETVDEPNNSRFINWAVLRYASRSTQWPMTRAKTVVNLPASMVAAAVLWDTLRQDEYIREALKDQEEIAALLEAAKQIEKFAEIMLGAMAQALAEMAENDQDEPGATGEACDGSGDSEGASGQESGQGGQGRASEGQAETGKSAAEKFAELVQQKITEALDGVDINDAEAMQEKAEELRKQAAEMLAAAIEKLEDDYEDGQLSTVIGSAISKASGAAEQANDFVKSMQAGVEPGSDQQINPQDAIDLLATYDDKIQDISRLSGRFSEIAAEAVTDMRDILPLIPDGVDYVEDIDFLYTDELAILAGVIPGAEALGKSQVIQLLEGGLAGYDMKAPVEKKGPFVAAVDVSGSMTYYKDLDGYSAETVAKAIALGLARLAQAQGRDFILFTFSTSSDEVYVATSQDDWRDIVSWAGRSRGGGTDLGFALRTAIKYIGELPGRSKRFADILLISDNEGWIDDDAVEEWEVYKASSDARLINIPVGSGYTESIEKIADVILPVEELTAGDGADLSNKLGRLF